MQAGNILLMTFLSSMCSLRKLYFTVKFQNQAKDGDKNKANNG